MSLPKLHPYQTIGILALIFICISLVTPPDPLTIERYNLTNTTYRIVVLSAAIIPAILTWIAACYGYVQLRRYAHTIAKFTEGPAFLHINKGIRWLAFGLPTVSLISLALNAIANSHGGFRGTAIVLTNYTTVIIAITAATFLGNGARLLADTSHARPYPWLVRLISLVFVTTGVLYCYSLVIHSADGPSPYHLPMGLLLLTVVVPFLYAWFIGFFAALDINAYSLTVDGLLFRKALRQFSAGIALVVSSSILIQFVNTANPQGGQLLLGGTLLLRYIAYLAMVVGFVVIAKSAKKLQQIENI